MELETVCRITVGDHGLQIGGQVDNVDCVERTFLWTNTTTNAQTFRNEGNLGLWSDFDAQLASANHWARLLAFLATFLDRSVSYTWWRSKAVGRHTFGLH
jgi:hypothetical protein